MDIDQHEKDQVASKYAAEGASTAAAVEEEEDEMPRNPANTRLRFRNYVPNDKPLRKHHMRPAPPDLVKQLEEQFSVELAIVDDEELLQDASKEANWDLKRELSEKVAVMDAATQVALSQLLRLKMVAK